MQINEFIRVKTVLINSLTKLKKWNLRLSFCDTHSKVSTHVNRRDNNCALFELRWKENLLKNQNVSKYYENDCS